MSYEPEEPEDLGHEPNREPVKINVQTEISFGEVLDRIAEFALRTWRERYSDESAQGRVRRVIEQTIVAAVHERARAVVDRLVDAAVEKIMTEGWAPRSTDDWGAGTREPTTLAGLIQKTITTKGRENYNAPERTVIERQVDAYVAAETRKALDEELAAARQRFRAAVDAMIEAKVVEAARAALLGSR